MVPDEGASILTYPVENSYKFQSYIKSVPTQMPTNRGDAARWHYPANCRDLARRDRTTATQAASHTRFKIRAEIAFLSTRAVPPGPTAGLT